MRDTVLDITVRILFPVILLYGLFVVIHGHLSPGGGFTGGAIMGAAMLLLGLAKGSTAAHRLLTESLSTAIDSGGALLYLASGLTGLLLGSRFLANKAAGFPVGTPGQLLSSGLIWIIGLAVGAKVLATMWSLFTALAGEE
ncbi:MAG: MnhB domain-containing protein [Bacillota bacterium]